MTSEIDLQEKLDIFQGILIQETQKRIRAEKELRDHKDNPLVFLTRSEANELRHRQIDLDARIELKDIQIKNFKIERKENREIVHDTLCRCVHCRRE